MQVRDFRSYSARRPASAARLSVVHGPNGAGKSNLLEAIYYGCTGRSPRTRNERELVRFGAEAARVTVQLLDGDEPHELAVGFGAAPGAAQPAKRMSADGAPVERVLDVGFRPLVSVFLPDRLELIKGPPALRRSHMDQLVAALWPARAADRGEYSRALAQRNALLAGSAPDAPRGPRWGHGTTSWPAPACACASAARGPWSCSPSVFAERARGLGVAGEVSLALPPPGRRVADAEEYVRELSERLERDLERGFTGYGPHRDELAVLRDGRELRVYGSQGEQRLALLALLLAERAVLAQERGQIPLMLLDDVMSELDAERREMLAGELRSGRPERDRDDRPRPRPRCAATRPWRACGSRPGAVMQEAIAA